jgi:hypothetical protein
VGNARESSFHICRDRGMDTGSRAAAMSKMKRWILLILLGLTTSIPASLIPVNR